MGIYSMGIILDPKMEVLYHIRPYFGGIFPYIGLIYGRYLQFRFLEWALIYGNVTPTNDGCEVAQRMASLWPVSWGLYIMISLNILQM